MGALAAAASGCGTFLMCYFAVGLQSAPAKVPQSAIILHILEAATLSHAHATLNYCTDNTMLRHGLGQSQLEARAQGRGRAAGAQAEVTCFAQSQHWSSETTTKGAGKVSGLDRLPDQPPLGGRPAVRSGGAARRQ